LLSVSALILSINFPKIVVFASLLVSLLFKLTRSAALSPEIETLYLGLTDSSFHLLSEGSCHTHFSSGCSKLQVFLAAFSLCAMASLGVFLAISAQQRF
jgi:hypothetical protein